MSVKELGSLLIAGVYRDAGLKAGLNSVLSNLKRIRKSATSVTTEMFRMSKQSALLGAALGAIGIGGFAGLMGAMPRVNAQLRIAHTYIKLVAIELDDNLAPIFETVNELLKKFHDWFVDLPEPIQTFITIAGGILGGGLIGRLLKGAGAVGIFTGALGAIKKVGKSFITWLGRMGLHVIRFLAPLLSVKLLIAAIILVIAYLVLDKLGVFDWLGKMWKKFEDAREAGDLFASALSLLIAPLELLVSAIATLVGAQSWDDFKKDVQTQISAFKTLNKAVETFKDTIAKVKIPEWIGKTKSMFGIGVHAVGGQAAYTGWHWLESGETVIPRGVGAATGGGGSGQTTINNTFTGNIVLNNRMDIDEFIKEVSRRQSRNFSWRSY